jgi:hypothetical protein
MKRILTFLLISLIAFSTFSKVYGKERKFNMDLYGGVGSHKLIGENIKGYKSPFNVFYSLRARYKLYKDIELETGFGQSQFGSFLQLGSAIDIVKTYNIPVLLRFPVAKHFIIGLGPEFNLLNRAYQTYNDIDTDLSEFYNSSFWGPYADIKYQDYNFTFGISYSQSIQPARISLHKWNTRALRIYIGINIAELIRIRLLGMY